MKSKKRRKERGSKSWRGGEKRRKRRKSYEIDVKASRTSV